MQLKTRTWALISLGCLLGAVYFWNLGNERARQSLPERPAEAPVFPDASNVPPATSPVKPDAGQTQTSPTDATNAPSPLAPFLAYRLSNTPAKLDILTRRDTAVLLRNALIDTAEPVDLNIPQHLRSEGEPGSYVVQSRGALDDAFRSQLQSAGVTIVSYIPNNAYLVRLSQGGAARLRQMPRTQSVLPWQPYYKLDLTLLPLAIEQTPAPEDLRLGVLLWPGEREAGIAALRAAGAELTGEARTPFGDELFVKAPPNSLPALARLTAVQAIEPQRQRKFANDLVRPRIGLTPDSVTNVNYLDLQGANVMVGVSDSGVDETHPDLTGRVFGLATTDQANGHGTHVAGTIAGDGTQSGTVDPKPSGSVSNANFRGMAPSAALFTLPVNMVDGPASDVFLQETLAGVNLGGTTNILVSNNSWNYLEAYDYDLATASYDAATRDALPGIMGSQPLLFVFSAGNAGGGRVDGSGGVAGSILSPAGGKNVVTVGAFEQLRRITNRVVTTNASGNIVSNQPFLGLSDSSNQVAATSSRGNVGIGIEGFAGRFKPDLVAPGTFVVSCRSQNLPYVDPVGGESSSLVRVRNQRVQPGQTNLNSIYVPPDALRMQIRVVRNAQSPTPLPDLPIYVRQNEAPNLATDLIGYRQADIDPVSEGTWYYAVGNTNAQPVNYDLLVFLVFPADNVAYFEELQRMNDQLGSWYRYGGGLPMLGEGGTSQAAAAVSGVAALMQEMFEQRLGRTNSPALMKALLINGSRSLGTPYDLQVDSSVNHQGWGRVVISNSIPRALAGGAAASPNWPLVLFDQDTNVVLTTGESHTRTITLSSTAQFYPLRVTLVWTDPPGNPAASLKLVNDLDLIVSNNIPSGTNSVGEFYVGNDFASGSDFTSAVDPSSTNGVPYDNVNNVENVFINRPLSSSYTITVRARRVNVNAVPGQTKGIAQDYALVISSGNSRLSNAAPYFTVGPAVALPPTAGYDPALFLKPLAENSPLLNERVGANSPLLPTNSSPSPSFGATNQWNFYVYEHTDTTLSNIAILTFLPPNLSRARYLDADIDLYVSTDSALTNFDESVIAQCAANASVGYRSSRRRGGSELVIYPNTTTAQTFYVGVKSEDQQAAEFGLVAIATSSGFGPDENGNYPLNFTPVPLDIPDGPPSAPGWTNLFAVSVAPFGETTIRRLLLTNTLTHEKGGDLFGILNHEGTTVVLNNHRSFDGTETFEYDDSGENDMPDARPPDGPGSLRDFAGEPVTGAWIFTMVDNALYHTGRVDSLVGLIEPQQDTNDATSDAITMTVLPQSWRYRTCEVPQGATNLTVWTRFTCPPACPDCELWVFIRRDDFPTLTEHDKMVTNYPPGGYLTLGRGDDPPLQPGRYYVGIFNPTDCPITFTQGCLVDWGLQPLETVSYISTNSPVSLFDDARTNDVITVTNVQMIADLSVGVRVNHPRVSDLAIHLTSPAGTRLLLFENRGSTIATNLGFGNNATNFTYATFTERTNLGPPIKFALPPYGLTARSNHIVFTNSFEDAWQTNYPATNQFADTREVGLNNYWTVLTNNAWIITDTDVWLENTNLTVLPRSGSNVLSLNDARVSHSLQLRDDHDYLLRFAHRKVSSSPTQTVVVPISRTANIFHYLNPTSVPANANYSTPPPLVPHLRLCPGQEVSITVSTNCLGLSPTKAVCSGPEGEPNNLFNDLPLYSLVGCWAYSPCEGLTTNVAAGPPFYIGTNTMGTNPTLVVTAPTAPGNYYLYLGINDDDLTNNLGTIWVTSRWQQCQLTSGQFIFSGLYNGATNSVTNSFASEAFWQTNELLFTARPFMQELIFQPEINTTLLLDSVEVIEPLGSFYQPEESLSPFRGQSARGDWKLEVTDTRTGTSALDMGALLSWNLNFVFAEPLMVPLSNGVWYCGTVRSDSVRYFIVEVPREVTWVDNQIQGFGGGGQIEFAYNPMLLPLTDPPDPAFTIIAGNGTDTFRVDANTPTPDTGLRPGQHYLLGVKNSNPGETNNFCIRIDFDIPVIPLTNDGVCPTMLDYCWVTSIPENPDRYAMWTNSSAAVTNMQYYRFMVPGEETNLLWARFTVDYACDPTCAGPGCRLGCNNKNVNLVVRRELPVVDHFPRPNFFDYESTFCDNGIEQIVIRTNAIPVRLQPGAYYLGVYSMNTNCANYRIRAEFFTGTGDCSAHDPPDLFFNDPPVIRNVPPVSWQPPPIYQLTNNSSFGTNGAVFFEISGLNEDVDLIVRRADLPWADLHEFSWLRGLEDFLVSETNRLNSSAFTASATASTDVPLLAFDGNSESYWDAGAGVPQWIEVDLGSPQWISRCTLEAGNPLGNGSATHQVILSLSPIGATPAGTVSTTELTGNAVDHQLNHVSYNLPVLAQYVQVRTLATVGKATWREIKVFANPRVADEVICLKTNAFSDAGSTNRFIPLLVPTNVVPFLDYRNSSDWFMSIVNRGANPVAASICVKALPKPACINCAGDPVDTVGLLPELPDWTHLNNPPVVILTNHVSWGGTVTNDGWRYFMVDVPCQNGSLTINFTASGPVEVWSNPGGLPMGAGGDVLEANGPSGTWGFNPPSGLPGPYYWGIRNPDPLNNVTVVLTADVTCPPGLGWVSPPSGGAPGVGFMIQWATDVGQTYTLEKSTNLVEWWAIGTYSGNGTVMSYTETNSAPAGFYRIR